VRQDNGEVLPVVMVKEVRGVKGRSTRYVIVI
jgi:hypothetical protein